MTKHERKKIGRPSFTLIELLVVTTIIAIMASAALFALYTVQEQARVDHTKGMIAKLNTMIMVRWERYGTRRVPIAIPPISSTYTQAQAAKLRLDGLRELMRMELPDRWTDITDAPVTLDPVNGRPSLSKAYLARYTAISGTVSDRYQGAECLYLIITMGLVDETGTREHFSQGDIGDKDGDGAMEFLDGWGSPIRFLRWAPGFRSELQTGDPSTSPDPFDPRHVYPNNSDTSKGSDRPTFAIYPLIYSAGSDEIVDILSDFSSTFSFASVNNNPFFADSGGDQLGKPMDLQNGNDPANGEENAGDNIHNHLLQSRTK